MHLASHSGHKMDVDSYRGDDGFDNDDNDEEGDKPETKIVLVDEDEFEGAFLFLSSLNGDGFEMQL